jgi:hypothetical protein
MTNPFLMFPEAPTDQLEEASSAPSSSPFDFSPLPGGATYPLFHKTSPLTPMVCDRRAITRLLGTLLEKAGISVGEASRRLGMNDQSLRPYLKGRRTKPSLLWFLKYVEACGGKVYIEFPNK